MIQAEELHGRILEEYIVDSENYNDDYSIPVLTANKGFVLGYTNEEQGIYDKGNVIIYDDFTMDMKYVSFKFKVKSSAMKMLTEKKGINLFFVYSCLKSLNLHQSEHSRSYISKLEPMKIFIPCLEEQQKIADFLSTVDQKIEKQKAIVADYEELKKGTMQKIFNQEIRFKDDDGNEFPKWEEKKLGEVSYLRGRIGFRGYTREDIVEIGGVISLSPTNIINGHVDFEKGTYISEFKYEESPEIKLAEHDIVFVKTASIGKIGYIKELKEKATINPQMAIITAQGINSFYLFLAMNTKDNKAFVRSITVGGVVPTLSQEELKKMIIPCPCLEEQKKIANCLSALDRKIEVEKKILADLEELKKGLLQGIFNN